jgi:ferrous iron transport protein A
MEIQIAVVHAGEEVQITRLIGGYGFRRRLTAMGIREGKLVKVVARQPFGGPIVVEIDGRCVTMGRGMCRKIMVMLKE